MAEEKNRDLLLYPDTYVYMANEGKNGIVNVYVGPGVVNQTGQDKPVFYDESKRTYRQVPLDQAVRPFPRAEEGDYVILENPAADEKFPTNNVQQAAGLNKGRKIVIPGPWSNALWPGQSAKVVQGHRLRSNQYLVVVIYNEEEAKKNWKHAVIKTADGVSAANALKADESKFVVGQRIVIRGTDVSFYIPPTGVEVQSDEKGQYVREAVTLEQLEYCILKDETGDKRYPRGPQVVFPEPTEVFLADEQGNRKFKAMELNNIQGIHIKVTQAHTEGGQARKEGEELFITGKETSIYYLRPEHTIIQYGNGNLKHYATAIPPGEGRYVMNRDTGEVDLTVGPKMLLPDPRNEVIVRRILSKCQCELWYPGNPEAIAYNENLRQLMAQSASSRSGFLSEGDYQRGTGQHLATQLEAADAVRTRSLAAVAESAGQTFAGDQRFMRNINYTQPRTLTLDTKYDGVPGINLWTGYACQIVSKTGSRRVVVGPTTVLLNYDETLEVLTLSTGKPKTTDTLYKTVYLRVTNNKIGDIIDVETADHVPCKIKLSLCVNFEGDPNKWFDIENYVKFLTDHVRSILKGVVKKRTVEDFYANYLPIIRDAILGAKEQTKERPGLAFPENGMRVSDVEILDVTLGNQQIAQLLQGMQYEVVKQNISLAQARKNLEVTKEQERLTTETAEAKAESARRAVELQADQVRQNLELELAKVEAELRTIEEKKKTQQESQALLDISHNGAMSREKSKSEQDLSIQGAKAELTQRALQNETECAVRRLEASKEGIAEALVALGRQETLVKVAEAVKIDTFLSGQSMEGALSRIFAGLPFIQQVLEKTRGAVPEVSGNGNRLTQTPALPTSK